MERPLIDKLVKDLIEINFEGVIHDDKKVPIFEWSVLPGIAQLNKISLVLSGITDIWLQKLPRNLIAPFAWIPFKTDPLITLVSFRIRPAVSSSISAPMQVFKIFGSKSN